MVARRDRFSKPADETSAPRRLFRRVLERFRYQRQTWTRGQSRSQILLGLCPGDVLKRTSTSGGTEFLRRVYGRTIPDL